MKYNFDGYNYVIKLEKNERLSEVMIRFVEETNIEGGWVEGLGTVSEVTLGFYNLGSHEFKWRPFSSMREVVSLTGNIAFNESGEFLLHMHGVFSDDEYQTVGGHIKDLIVGATLELFVHHLYKPLRRRHDNSTGLNLLAF